VPLPAPYGGRKAFVPDDLPPPIEYGPDLAAALSQAEYALGGLAVVADFVPNPELFVEPFLRVEAVLSSRIEGTQTTTEDIFRAEADESAHLDADTQEVMNYVEGLEVGFERVREGGGLHLGLVCDLHERLLDSVRGHDRSPGRFREITVWVGSGGRSIEHASYVPPPWQEVPRLMRQWESYVLRCAEGSGREGTSPLIQCAAMHAQLEMIHPFLDGNGRLGRLLMSLFLVATGRLSKPVLFLSAYFEQRRQEYYRRLRAISEEGDWPGWMAFFLRGVEVQSARAARAAKAILDLRSEWQSRLQAGNAPANVFALLDRLVENPYTTAKRVRRQLKVSAPTAGKAIARLVDMGLLEEVTGRKRDRQYRAAALLRALQELAEEAV
jgi:Fic family protein